jgi:hypothetical protein
LADHVLLAVETAADALGWFALRGGTAPLAERVALAPASPANVRALETLITRHRDDLERLRDGAPVDAAFDGPLRAAATAAWSTLPEAVAAKAASARTVLFWSSAWGSLGQLPLELFHDGNAWLGCTRSIGRIGSWRCLAELLAPNRMPTSLAPRARIVRARDLAGAAALERAAAEAIGVELALQRRGLVVSVDTEPTRTTLRGALDSGDAVLHFIGHGHSSGGGERLPLDDGDEALRPEDLSQLDGWRTPFVYLSTCEVGRTRAGRSGRVIGFAPRLGEKGAIAAIGCLHPIDDEVALEMAGAFWRAPASSTLGEALAEARCTLVEAGYPAAAWGAHALFGDPDAGLPTADAPLRRLGQRTLGWAGLATRWAVLREPRWRDAACAALALDACATWPRGDRERVDAWLRSSFGPVGGEDALEHGALRDRIAALDPHAGAALAILLALELLDSLERPPAAGPRFMLADPLGEVVGAMRAAQGVHDLLAWPALATRAADLVLAGRPDASARHLARRWLDEAEGALRGWLEQEPAAAPLLAEIATARLRVAETG